MNTAEAALSEDRGQVLSTNSSVGDRPGWRDGSTERYFIRLARAAALVLLSIGVHVWIDGRRQPPQPSNQPDDLLLTSSPARTRDVPALPPLASASAGPGAARAVTDGAFLGIAERPAATTGRFQDAVGREGRVPVAPADPGSADSSPVRNHGLLRTSALPDLAHTDHTVIPAAHRLSVWARADDALLPVVVPEPGPTQVERAAGVTSLARVSAAVTTAAPPVPAPRPADEEASILQVLRRYERAVAQKDPLGAKAVWPTLDDRALARAFNDLQSHSLALQDCGVTVDSVEARATCLGVATYLPKVGRRKTIRASHEWTFDLAKEGGGWHIESAAIQ